MTYICAGCGKDVKHKDVKGSIKHPYCKKCYKKYFDDNDESYNKFVGATHL